MYCILNRKKKKKFPTEGAIHRGRSLEIRAVKEKWWAISTREERVSALLFFRNGIIKHEIWISLSCFPQSYGSASAWHVNGLHFSPCGKDGLKCAATSKLRFQEQKLLVCNCGVIWLKGHGVQGNRAAASNPTRTISGEIMINSKEAPDSVPGVPGGRLLLPPATVK